MRPSLAASTRFLAMALLAGIAAGCAEPAPPSASVPGGSPTSAVPSAAVSTEDPAVGSPSPGVVPSSTGPSAGPTEPPVPTPTPVPTPGPTPRPTEPPAIAEFPQTWAGTWMDPGTGAGGSLDLVLTGKGSGFGGSITMDGTACVASGVLTGSYDGRGLRFTVSQRDVEIAFEGVATPGAISGTFVTACDGMDGTWEVTRTGR